MAAFVATIDLPWKFHPVVSRALGEVTPCGPIAQAHPLPERSAAYGPYTKLGGIAEDGQYGPQTDFALKHATARLGPDKVAEGLALGRFNTFTRDAQSRGDTASPKVEAGALQATLNGFGQNLKQDDWIGPKTTQAFAQVLRQEDADQVTQALGRRLGWL